MNKYQVYAWRVSSGDDGGIKGEVIIVPIFARSVFHQIRWRDSGQGIDNADLRLFVFSSDTFRDNIIFLPYECNYSAFHSLKPSVVFENGNSECATN